MKKRHFLLLLLLLIFPNALSAQNNNLYYEVIRGERPPIDLTKVPYDAFEKGIVNIKFKSAVSKHLDATPVTLGSDKIVRFGLSSVDVLNVKYKTKKSSLLFSTKNSRKEFSQKYRAWGFDRWYKLEVDESADIKAIIAELGKPGI
jgi:hypothetical protein